MREALLLVAVLGCVSMAVFVAKTAESGWGEVVLMVGFATIGGALGALLLG